jgi:hypothetical protein
MIAMTRNCSELRKRCLVRRCQAIAPNFGRETRVWTECILVEAVTPLSNFSMSGNATNLGAKPWLKCGA